MYYSSNLLPALSLIWLSITNQLVSVHASGINPRIINGEAADRNTYPNAMVIIADREQNLVCGGTLISPTIVMTAAHCASGILEYIIVGRYNRINPLEEFDTIPIIAERVHPEFNAQTLDNDVLLIQMERPPTIDIKYMLLNSVNSMPPVGVDLKVLGWGETQPNGSDLNGTPILQTVDLTYVSNDECATKANGDDDYRGKIKDSMLCTFVADADHCYGDSGGPVLAVSPLDPTVVMQVAIISWGAEKCADGFFPGVSQRVSTSYDWIASWVCAIDGEADERTKARYSCETGQTFSPVPTPAPAPPTISPAPTVYAVHVWIELHMDEWPEDTRWTITDKVTGVPAATSPSYAGTTDDIIVEMVALAPGRTYEFTITDDFGDGFADGGFYQVRLGDELSTATVLFTGNLDAIAVHSFNTPERTPAPVAPSTPIPTAAPSVRPTPAPTSTPTIKPTGSPSSPPSGALRLEPETSCFNVGATCIVHDSCCSQRCILGQCQKTRETSNTRTNNSKVSIGQSRGGAAGGGGVGVLRGGTAGGFRELRNRADHR
jgi:trypsin